MSTPFPYKRITADDWGMSPAVNEGILQLVEKGIVKRVSLLADAPFLDVKLSQLLNHQIDFGLHFDLTLKNRKNNTNPFDSGNLFKYLFGLQVSQKQKVEDFKSECKRQLESLADLKVPVSYLDGHQHVHLLPLVSKGVASAMSERVIKLARNPYSTDLWKTKKFSINLLSMLSKRAYLKKEISLTHCLYPQKKAHQSTEALNAFLSKSPESEFIFHPAVRNDFDEVGCEDSYREERTTEFTSLMGLVELREW